MLMEGSVGGNGRMIRIPYLFILKHAGTEEELLNNLHCIGPSTNDRSPSRVASIGLSTQ
jgi:hypothetical protein